MDYFWYVAAFLFGAIIGSFLNVVIYRLHTGKSVNGHSHCLSCGTGLRWYELVPMLSYLVLRGHCRTCAAWIPVRYLLVELLTAGLFVLVWHIFNDSLVLLVLHAVLVSVLVVILVYDLRHMIIPDVMVVALTSVALVYLAYGFFGGGMTGEEVVVHIISAAGAALFFAAFWLVSGGRWMGLGDAKLALPLGMFLGVSGAFSMVVFSFWIGAVVSVILLLLQNVYQAGTTRLPFSSTPLRMKSEIPFAPFLILGFLLTYLFHVDIFTILLF